MMQTSNVWLLLTVYLLELTTRVKCPPPDAAKDFLTNNQLITDNKNDQLQMMTDYKSPGTASYTVDQTELQTDHMYPGNNDVTDQRTMAAETSLFPFLNNISLASNTTHQGSNETTSKTAAGEDKEKISIWQTIKANLEEWMAPGLTGVSVILIVIYTIVIALYFRASYTTEQGKKMCPVKLPLTTRPSLSLQYRARKQRAKVAAKRKRVHSISKKELLINDENVRPKDIFAPLWTTDRINSYEHVAKSSSFSIHTPYGVPSTSNNNSSVYFVPDKTSPGPFESIPDVLY